MDTSPSVYYIIRGTVNPTRQPPIGEQRKVQQSFREITEYKIIGKMTDTFSPETRSRIMRRVRGLNTKPEIKVRSFLHRSGLRFRIHCKNLPGKPDIVLPKHSAVVFVNGCFWHQHQGCKRADIPHSNREYWRSKLQRNVERDRDVKKELESNGWRVFIIWECELTEERLKSLVHGILRRAPK